MNDSKKSRGYCQNLFNKMKKPAYEINGVFDVENFVLNKLPTNTYELTTIGRDFSFKIIKFRYKSNDYGIPLMAPKDIVNKYKRHRSGGERLLEEKMLLIVPFIPNFKISKLFNDAIIDYSNIYTIDYLFKQVQRKYSKINYFDCFIGEIMEIINSIKIKNCASAIVLQLVVVEGISRRYCIKNNLEFDSKGSKDAFRVTLKDALNKWRDNILFQTANGDKVVLPIDFYESDFLRRIDEGMDLLQSFYDFGIDYLYRSTNSNGKDEIMCLSRHDILHGKDMGYINELNMYRLVSCIESLAFAVTLNPFN